MHFIVFSTLFLYILKLFLKGDFSISSCTSFYLKKEPFFSSAKKYYLYPVKKFFFTEVHSKFYFYFSYTETELYVTISAIPNIHSGYSSNFRGTVIRNVSAGFLSLNSNVSCAFVSVWSLLVPIISVIKIIKTFRLFIYLNKSN